MTSRHPFCYIFFLDWQKTGLEKMFVKTKRQDKNIGSFNMFIRWFHEFWIYEFSSDESASWIKKVKRKRQNKNYRLWLGMSKLENLKKVSRKSFESKNWLELLWRIGILFAKTPGLKNVYKTKRQDKKSSSILKMPRNWK